MSTTTKRVGPKGPDPKDQGRQVRKGMVRIVDSMERKREEKPSDVIRDSGWANTLKSIRIMTTAQPPIFDKNGQPVEIEEIPRAFGTP